MVMEVNDDGLKWPRGKDAKISILIISIKTFSRASLGLQKNGPESTEFSCSLPSPKLSPIIYMLD